MNVVHDIRELTRVQLEALIDKAEIKGTGVFKAPPLDLTEIKRRADELDATSQTKADIYMLLQEICRLAK